MNSPSFHSSIVSFYDIYGWMKDEGNSQISSLIVQLQSSKEIILKIFNDGNGSQVENLEIPKQSDYETHFLVSILGLKTDRF